VQTRKLKSSDAQHKAGPPSPMAAPYRDLTVLCRSDTIFCELNHSGVDSRLFVLTHVLCCAVLCCDVLCCAVLCCDVLRCAVL
jgi:hypothetical protein